jgi:hypothetical protein
MTTPNAFTRSTLVGVAGHMTHALSDLAAVLPHMRVVAASAVGDRGAVARRAVEEAEALETELRVLDARAEATKTLFRSATTTVAIATPDEAASRPHICPPALLSLTDNGPAARLGDGAASVRRQV